MKYREHRFPCDKAVRVLLRDGQARSAFIVNVSTFGARLTRLAAVCPGDRIYIALGSNHHLPEAEVRWATLTHVGIRFRQQLTPRELAMVRQSAAHKSTTNAKGWNLQLQEMR
ncbi:PilZ domain-containing protein [Pararhodobacter sp.]|uniref:PilZ domain-containing protein n=1 Tax=Pararhodobacter sp. TaxID=2127056 RepID=UPI002AFDFB53|nr:PilZ domain-containing protein [Pararhodobacter sp.]